MKEGKIKRKHKGSNFEDFLKEVGIFEECHAEAVRKVIKWQLEDTSSSNQSKSKSSKFA